MDTNHSRGSLVPLKYIVDIYTGIPKKYLLTTPTSYFLEADFQYQHVIRATEKLE